MAIDYDTDILSLYAGDVGTDPAYASVPADRKDQTNEQRILTTLEAVTAHLRLLADRDEARELHFVLSRLMTAAGSGGFVYDDLTVGVSGNISSPVFTIGDDIELQVIDPADGSDVVAATVSTATGTTLTQVVTDINTAMGAAAGDFLAVDDNGKLRLTSDNGYTIVVLSGGVNNTITTLAGLEYGSYKNKAVEVADNARDEAVAQYIGSRREAAL